MRIFLFLIFIYFSDKAFCEEQSLFHIDKPVTFNYFAVDEEGKAIPQHHVFRFPENLSYYSHTPIWEDSIIYVTSKCDLDIHGKPIIRNFKDIVDIEVANYMKFDGNIQTDTVRSVFGITKRKDNTFDLRINYIKELKFSENKNSIAFLWYLKRRLPKDTVQFYTLCEPDIYYNDPHLDSFIKLFGNEYIEYKRNFIKKEKDGLKYLTKNADTLFDFGTNKIKLKYPIFCLPLIDVNYNRIPITYPKKTKTLVKDTLLQIGAKKINCDMYTIEFNRFYDQVNHESKYITDYPIYYGVWHIIVEKSSKLPIFFEREMIIAQYEHWDGPDEPFKISHPHDIWKCW